MRYALVRFALAAALWSIPAAGAAADAPATPTLTASSDTLRADENGSWSLMLTLSNPLDQGVYADSLVLESDDADPGETGAPRHVEQGLGMLAKGLLPTSAHETNVFAWGGPARFDRGRLTFRLYVHAGGGQSFEVRRSVVVDGGVWASGYPSGIARAAGAAVEVVLLPAAGDGGPAPGLVLVPDEGGARGLLRQGLDLSRRGYAVVLVSPPGFGRSDGPPDLNGPATVKALAAALDTLERAPGVDARRIALWGLGRGGTAALLAAAGRRDVRAVVAENASYDLWADYRAASPDARRAIETRAGRDSAAWRARSPALLGEALRCPVLVLHDSGLALPPVASALGFAQARRERSASVQVSLHKGLAPRPWSADALREALAFLKSALAP